jgi:membrane-associated phospholipid phosphatase
MALNLIARLLSVVFHPIFLLLYMLLLLHSVNPYLFIGSKLNFAELVVRIAQFTIILPLVSVVAMKFLGFISELSMPTKEDRIGPYIATGIFYIWTYLNMADNVNIPPIFRVFVLGSAMALAAAFVINVFNKISLHTTGMGGVVAMVFLTFIYYSYLDISWVVITVIVAAGLVGTARLLLKAHTANDVLSGYFLGFVAQFIAFKILIGG